MYALLPLYWYYALLGLCWELCLLLSISESIWATCQWLAQLVCLIVSVMNSKECGTVLLLCICRWGFRWDCMSFTCWTGWVFSVESKFSSYDWRIMLPTGNSLCGESLNFFSWVSFVVSMLLHTQSMIMWVCLFNLWSLHKFVIMCKYLLFHWPCVYASSTLQVLLLCRRKQTSQRVPPQTPDDQPIEI